MIMEKKREQWLDNIRAMSCIFVVATHLLESLVRSNVLEDNVFPHWIAYIARVGAVPVYFFCSGYIYQKYHTKFGWDTYFQSIKKRFLSLMVPYIIFCVATYTLKAVFASLVNTPTEGSLLENIFFSPPNQMWFLIILFIFYIITPVFQSQKQGLLFLGLSIVLRVFYVVITLNGASFFYNLVLGNWIFFIFGMFVSVYGWSFNGKISYLGLLAIPLTVWVVAYFPDELRFGVLMAFLYLLLFIFIGVKLIGKTRVLSQISSNMLYIYLLHTMCAAPFRIVLLKIGIYFWPVHLVVGFAVSLVAPIVVAYIAKKWYWIDFVFSPARAVSEWKKRRKPA